MYCNNCGALLEEGAAFCASCGTPVALAQPQQETFAPVSEPEQANPQAEQPQVTYAQPQQTYAQPAQPFAQQMPPQGYQQPNPYQNAPYGMGGFSQNSIVIAEYLKEAKRLRTWGIVATVLMFGIGFIISIVNFIQMKKLKEPMLYNPTPAEIAELENAKKVLKTAKILSYIPFIALAISFVVGFVQGLTGAV